MVIAIVLASLATVHQVAILLEILLVKIWTYIWNTSIYQLLKYHGKMKLLIEKNNKKAVKMFQLFN